MKNYCVIKTYKDKPSAIWEGMDEETACNVANSLTKEPIPGVIKIGQMIRCQRCNDLTDWKVCKKYCLLCSRLMTNVRQRALKEQSILKI